MSGDKVKEKGRQGVPTFNSALKKQDAIEDASLQDRILGDLGGQVGPRQLLWPLHSQSPFPNLLDFDQKGFQFHVCWKTAVGSRKHPSLLAMATAGKEKWELGLVITKTLLVRNSENI